LGPVLDPRSRRVQRWNRWILLGRAAALAVDPLFFYALSIGRAGQPCLYMDAGLASAVTALRTCADVAHLAHVLLQLRLAYVSRESLVVGCGKLVWDARAVAAHYARSVKGLCFDLFVILPIPQVSCPADDGIRTQRTVFLSPRRCCSTVGEGQRDQTPPKIVDMPIASF
jgi:cyclic nucleotide gated channel, plant